MNDVNVNLLIISYKESYHDHYVGRIFLIDPNYLQEIVRIDQQRNRVTIYVVQLVEFHFSAIK